MLHKMLVQGTEDVMISGSTLSGYTHEQDGQVRLCHKTSKKACATSKNKEKWKKPRKLFAIMMGRENFGKGKKQFMILNIPRYL